MKRRNVLTTATTLAGATLAGCGGGGEDLALGGDPSSQIGAYTIPRNLVPTNATQYQVEVVFHTTRQCHVYMKGTNTGTRLLVEKAGTTGISHKVGFALFRCTSASGYTNANFSLEIKEIYITSSSTVTQVYVAGTSNTTPDNYRQYLKHTDGATEYEWNFFSRSSGSPLVSVRFFPLPAAEHTTFPAGVYIQTIANTATHYNAGGLDKTLPKHHATSLATAKHEAAVIKASNNKDTICLPNTRGADGHVELVPSYLAASAAEKPLLKRRLLRHVDRHARHTRRAQAMTDANNKDVGHLLGNEIMRVIGGASLIEHLNGIRDHIMASAAQHVGQMGTAFGTFCANNLPALTSAEMNNHTRNLLDAVENGEAGSMNIGGASGQAIVQLGFNLTQTEGYLPGVHLGGGARVTLGLAKSAKKWKGGSIQSSTYTIDQLSTGGLRLAFTFVAKGIEGSFLTIGGFAMEVEVTFACTVIDGKWRLDAILFDPILDIDTNGFIGKMVTKGMARLLAAVIDGTRAVAALPTEASFAQPVYLAGIGLELETFAGNWSANGAELVDDCINRNIKPMLDAAKEKLSNTPLKLWNVAEFNFLRSTFVNGDINDPAIPFRGGWHYGGNGWQPGLNYMCGAGVSATYVFGPVTANGYLRVAAVGDLYGVFGPPDYIRALHYPWNF